MKMQLSRRLKVWPAPARQIVLPRSGQPSATFEEAVARFPPRRREQTLDEYQDWLKSWVYFLTDGVAIKIGTAACVETRIASLQTGHHSELVLLGQMKGNRDDERRLHWRWRKHRIRGEWFRDVPQIRTFIETGELS